MGLWLETKQEVLDSGAGSTTEREGKRKEATKTHRQLGLTAISVGASILATGLCSVLYQVLIRHTREEKRRLGEMRAAGLLAVHKKRELTQKYEDLVRNCELQLDVLGWSLRRFHDSYADLILSRCKAAPALRVRLLVVDPDSEEARFRVKSEGEGATYFHDCLRTLQAFAAKCPRAIQIRKLLPSVRIPSMFFRIDSRAFVGPYFHGERSNLAITYECEDTGWSFRMYAEQFESLWRDFSEAA